MHSEPRKWAHYYDCCCGHACDLMALYGFVDCDLVYDEAGWCLRCVGGSHRVEE